MTYATKEEVKAATDKGYEHESNQQRGCSFSKEHRNIWSIREGWQTADLIDGRYCNHQSFDDLIDAINRSA